MILQGLKNKNILIFGFGKEGIDNYLALRKLFSDKILAVADRKEIGELDKKLSALLKKDKKLRLHLGENYLRALKNYDLIIKTPGIPPKIYQRFLKKGSVVTSQTELFFDHFPGLIIGVTGTKGKGTTSSLVFSILKKAKLPVYLGGNIGQPVFQYLLKSKPEHIFIYELSSHQLQGLKKSPQIAVFLNLFPDHLDYYRNFQEYQEAKSNVATYQTKNDFLIYNSSDQNVKALVRKSKAQKIAFSSKQPLTLFEKSLKKHYRLKGDFNVLNLRAALKVAGLFKIPNRAVLQAVKEFKGLPHRLEFIRRYKGIDFYNDSMSTIPEVTMVALDALGLKVKTLIVGGSDKGSDYSTLAKKILKQKVKNLIIFPGTGEKVWALVKKSVKHPTPIQPFFVSSMADAVRIAFQKTKKDEICLLSPGAASFNLFSSYQERGNLFKKLVKENAKK